MFARITKDYLDCTDILGPEFIREGKVIVGTPAGASESLVKCRVYDDDDILYFDLEATDDEALEELFEWCQRDTGSTRLDVQRDGSWTTEIA